MKKKIFIVAGIILIFVLSEILYALNNPYNQIYLLFELSKIEAQLKKPDKALSILSTATDIAINENRKIYPQVIPENYSAEFNLPVNGNLQNEIVTYFTNKDPLRLSNEKKYQLPKILYELALLAVKNDEKNLYPAFLESAYYADPNLSLWAVELANYYYSVGDQNKSLEILDKCTYLEYPRKHCIEIKNQILSDYTPQELGFLSESIEEIYSYRLPFNPGK